MLTASLIIAAIVIGFFIGYFVGFSIGYNEGCKVRKDICKTCIALHTHDKKLYKSGYADGCTSAIAEYNLVINDANNRINQRIIKLRESIKEDSNV